MGDDINGGGEPYLNQRWPARIPAAKGRKGNLRLHVYTYSDTVFPGCPEKIIMKSNTPIVARVSKKKIDNPKAIQSVTCSLKLYSS